VIVEMVWGRPHYIVVHDTDDDGELIPVRTIRNGAPDPEWRRFSCRVAVWRALQWLARDHGWAPTGTSLDPKAIRWHQFNTTMVAGILSEDKAASGHSRLERAQMDVSYEPVAWAYAKVVSGPDAGAMADALESAVVAGACAEGDRRIDGPVYLREGMTREEYAAFNRGLSAPLVHEFVAFSRRGPFKFAWDED